MYKFAFVLFLVAAPCLFSQTKGDNLNVYVTRASSLFASNVSDLHHLDLANLRAVLIELGGQRGQWQALKHGRGKTVEIS